MLCSSEKLIGSTEIQQNDKFTQGISMLTNYVICVPLTDKSADTVVSVYLREVYCRIGGSRKSYLTIKVCSKPHYFQK